MATSVTFFPVDNGDMTLICLGDNSGTTILIDCNIRAAADDPDDKTRDVAKDLRERLKRDSNGRPYVDAFRRPRKMRNEKGAALGPIWRTIVTEATALSIPVYCVSGGEVRDAFRILQGGTKEQIAELLVEIFPELLTRLPPKRKKWQPEYRGMIVFDAVAVGFAYWHRNGMQFPPPE